MGQLPEFTSALFAGALLVLIIWAEWKLGQFRTMTWRQRAISKPQVAETAKALVKITLPLGVLFILMNVLVAPLTPGFFRNAWMIPFCLSMPIIWFLSRLVLTIISLRGLPVTELREVPIPKPPPPPPWADKSFDQLSHELEEALKQLHD